MMFVERFSVKNILCFIYGLYHCIECDTILIHSRQFTRNSYIFQNKNARLADRSKFLLSRVDKYRVARDVAVESINDFKAMCRQS